MESNKISYLYLLRIDKEKFKYGYTGSLNQRINTHKKSFETNCISGRVFRFEQSSIASYIEAGIKKLFPFKNYPDPRSAELLPLELYELVLDAIRKLSSVFPFVEKDLAEEYARFKKTNYDRESRLQINRRVRKRKSPNNPHSTTLPDDYFDLMRVSDNYWIDRKEIEDQIFIYANRLIEFAENNINIDFNKGIIVIPMCKSKLEEIFNKILFPYCFFDYCDTTHSLVHHRIVTLFPSFEYSGKSLDLYFIVHNRREIIDFMINKLYSNIKSMGYLYQP